MKYSKTVHVQVDKVNKYQRLLDLGTDINFEKEGIKPSDILLLIHAPIVDTGVVVGIEVCSDQTRCYAEAMLYNKNGGNMCKVYSIILKSLQEVINLIHDNGKTHDEYIVDIEPYF